MLFLYVCVWVCLGVGVEGESEVITVVAYHGKDLMGDWNMKGKESCTLSS